MNQNNRQNALSRVVITITLLLLTASCRREEAPNPSENGNANNARGARPGIEAAPVIERFMALESKRDSTTRVRVSITGTSPGAGLDLPRQLQLNIYRKHRPDGQKLILIEFKVPPEERDRGGLITVFPDGQIEGVRYIQSTDSFISTRDLMGEDSLFGLTLQELADGQPEKYDFSIDQEETVQGISCYRAQGRLKQGYESRFPRVVLYISKENFAAVEAKFYDSREVLVRDLVVSRTEQIAGQWTRLRWAIDNITRGKKIEFEAIDVNYEQNPKDSMFTREHLKKITSR